MCTRALWAGRFIAAGATKSPSPQVLGTRLPALRGKVNCDCLEQPICAFRDERDSEVTVDAGFRPRFSLAYSGFSGHLRGLRSSVSAALVPFRLGRDRGSTGRIAWQVGKLIA